jgi:hypothetical protein
MSEKISKLNSGDFNFIVQGPIYSDSEREGDRACTIRCLASIRTFFPAAEIILSTWKGADTEGLDCDILILNEDPGAVAYSEIQKPPGCNNVNRQIVSTRAGFAQARRPYAVKFRGDLAMESNNILNFSDLLTTPLTNGFFRSRVLVPPLFTYKPHRSLRPLHISDIVQVGRTDDLRDFWQVPLAPEPETTRWFEHRKSPYFGLLDDGNFKVRMFAEQYLICGWLAQHGKIVQVNHPLDWSAQKALLTQKILIENFCVLDLNELGVRFHHRFMMGQASCGNSIYRSGEWRRLSAAYRSLPSRWIAQVELVILIYVSFVEFIFKTLFKGTSIQRSPAFQWLRKLYRRAIPF